MRVIIFTPCRTSFALCVLLTLITAPEHLSDITFGATPRPVEQPPAIGRLIE